MGLDKNNLLDFSVLNVVKRPWKETTTENR